ncbi:MAG: hypothetical protein JOY96_00940 [Verrucomicrobia bacterium]|nr:hypothetical protein [Verrucomicrobiota bacterium]
MEKFLSVQLGLRRCPPSHRSISVPIPTGEEEGHVVHLLRRDLLGRRTSVGEMKVEVWGYGSNGQIASLPSGDKEFSRFLAVLPKSWKLQ